MLLQFYRDLPIFLAFPSNSMSGLARFYLGITGNFAGITVNSRFHVSALSSRQAAGHLFCYGDLIKRNRACGLAGRESLIIDIAFPRRRRSGNSSDRPWYVDKVTR